MKQLILASSSLRRREIIQKHGYDPVIMPAGVDETLPFNIAPEAATMYLAFKKASCIYDAVSASYKDCIILSADTAVLFNGKIIGKPHDPQEAFNILSTLRNDCHHVITGVCVMTMEGSTSDKDAVPSKKCLYEDTAVFFKDYSDESLTRYVNTSEPYDKAGGYAIQGTFKKYTDHIEGDLDNVVGLPWTAVEPLLKL